MEEVFEIADRVSVLRDGRHVITAPINELNPAEAIRHMVGRRLETLFPKEQATIGEIALEVRGLTRRGVFSNASFQVRRGEILGLAGLVGAGRTEIARVLFGIDRADAGEVLVAGKHAEIKSPKDAMRLGIVYVPEDRHAQGLVLDFSIAANVSLPIVERLSRLLVVAEAYPQLNADQSFLRLQDELTGTENRIAVARSDYNQAVQQYNTDVETYPGRFWASFYSAKPMATFTTTQENQRAPTVQF